MARQLAREKAFFLVFEYIFHKELNTESLKAYSSEEGITLDDANYVKRISEGVSSHFDELIEIVSNYSKDFKKDRLYKTDLAILLLAVYEIKYCADIDGIVSCNEAVNLAKTYSTENSPSYINGILANIMKDLNNKGNENGDNN